MNYQIILASQSPRRRELLSQMGMTYIVQPSVIEEKITKTNPWDVVMELAAQKAVDVFERQNADNALVIGADTIVAYGTRILGKPKSEEDAIDMLHLLQGNTHQVYTGVSLVWPKGRRTFCEKTDVEFYPMTKEEIADYVKSGLCMDKAGAYGIQTQFGVYVKRINGDYNNVVGLPIARLYQEMKKLEL